MELLARLTAEGLSRSTTSTDVHFSLTPVTYVAQNEICGQTTSGTGWVDCPPYDSFIEFVHAEGYGRDGPATFCSEGIYEQKFTDTMRLMVRSLYWDGKTVNIVVQLPLSDCHFTFEGIPVLTYRLVDV
jgi:hypothetical protein